MLRLVYRALWWIVAPLAVLRLLIRSRRERGYREHIGERFGFGPARRADDLAPLIWVHAVSVGETRAAQPLIEALQQAASRCPHPADAHDAERPRDRRADFRRPCFAQLSSLRFAVARAAVPARMAAVARAS